MPVEVTAYTNCPSDIRSRDIIARHRTESADANPSGDCFVKVFMLEEWNTLPSARYPGLAIELYRATRDLRKASWYPAP